MSLAADLEIALAIAFADPQSSGTDQARALELLSQLPNHTNPATVRDEEGRTLLHWACWNEWKDVANVLMERHIRCQSLDPTVVFLAFEYPSTTGTDQARALELLSRTPNPAAVRDKEGENLLHWAANNKWSDVVKFLIKKESELESVFRKKLNSYSTDRASVLQLLSWHPNPAAIRDKHGRSLLYLACQKEWGDAAKMLLERTSGSELDPTTLCLQFQYPSTTGTDQAGALQLLFLLPSPADVRDEEGRTLLHWACRNEWEDVANTLMEEHVQCQSLKPVIILAFKYPSTTGTDQARALQLLSQLPDPAAQVKSEDGNTLLHWASRNGWYDVVKELVEEYHCDPNYQVSFVQMMRGAEFGTGMQFACAAGHLDIVKYLVKQGGDPGRGNFRYSPLHTACEKGHLDIVKFLVTECHCNPLQSVTLLGINGALTPLHLACENKHSDVVVFLLSSGTMTSKAAGFVRRLLKVSYDSWEGMTDLFTNFIACLQSNPFHPAFKVFVMGNHSAGKSTLVKAVQSRMTDTSLLGPLTAKFKKVSGVELQTAGIIPIPIESQELGNIIMYDLAGQYQYYSSHAALLEKLVSSPGALLMVVIDLSKSKEEITQQLQYWSSFIENHCSQSSSKPAVVAIGSHADVVKSQKENPAQKSADILRNPSSSLQALDDIIFLNCTQLASDGLRKVCNAIGRHVTQFQKKFDIDLQVHFLYAFLSREFKGQTACRVSEVVHC